MSHEQLKEKSHRMIKYENKNNITNEFFSKDYVLEDNYCVS